MILANPGKKYYKRQKNLVTSKKSCTFAAPKDRLNFFMQ